MPCQRGKAGFDVPTDDSALRNSSIPSYGMSVKTTSLFIFKMRAAGCIALIVYGTFSSVAASPLKTLLWEGVHENGSGSTHARLYSVKEAVLFGTNMSPSAIHSAVEDNRVHRMT